MTHNIKAYYIVLVDDRELPPKISQRLSGPTTSDLAQAVLGLYRNAYEKWYAPHLSVEVMAEEDVLILEKRNAARSKNR